jgi:two-component system, NarL family, sensor histidine kinase BarA
MNDVANPPPPPPPQGLELERLGDGPQRLEELVDRRALREMMASFERLFGVPIRIMSASGAVLAEAGNAELAGSDGSIDGEPAPLRATPPAKDAIDQTVPASGGMVYRVFSIAYDRRAVGRAVIGPYLPLATDRASIPPGIAVLADARVDEIKDHLEAVLDVILFSGHKALLTSQMHIASVTESFRELCEKNERLEEAYERLKELDRLKSNFLATVSHELRTPLTSIMGYSEMLAEGVAGPLSPEQREFLDTIQVKSEHLLGLIISLLDLSKLESGTAQVRMGKIPIGGVLAEAVSTLAPAAKKKGLSIKAEVPDDLPLIFGDPDRLRQVFINLSENAIKFTPQGGSVRLVARATLEDPPDEAGLVLVAPLRHAVEVRVIDTGVGVPEAERERIFDAFYQIDQSSTREHGGAGLGLAIVKRLVESHEGSIRVEANEPSGAVFVVTLLASRGGSMRPPRGSTPPVFE